MTVLLGKNAVSRTRRKPISQKACPPQRRTSYHVTFVQSEEGVAVWCDDLPGCCSQGETKAEALANIKIAIREYLAARQEVELESGASVYHNRVLV